jgi:hypothetical protein
MRYWIMKRKRRRKRRRRNKANSMKRTEIIALQ